MGGVASYTVISICLLTIGGVHFGVIGPTPVRVGAVVAILYMAAAVLVRRRLVTSIPRGADDETRLGRYQAATIVGLALLESGGLVVITLGMLADAPGWILAGGTAAIWMMILGRPRAEEAGLTRSGAA
jgi:hypothetical protein